VVVSLLGVRINIAAWRYSSRRKLRRVSAQPICVSLQTTKTRGIGKGGANLATRHGTGGSDRRGNPIQHHDDQQQISAVCGRLERSVPDCRGADGCTA
jgi:hypothetical protein